MGVLDELEALRASGMVKSKSSRLSSAVDKNGFTSPEAEAEKAKLNGIQMRKNRLDAKRANELGGSKAGMGDLNLLYRKLIEEQRGRKREAEKNLREWKRWHASGSGKKSKSKKKGKSKNTGGDDGDGKEGSEDGDEDEDDDEDMMMPPMPPPEEISEDIIMNEEALEMLPEHVVEALKEKYATDDGAAALSQALREESENGEGTLAQLMDAENEIAEEVVILSVVKEDDGEKESAEVEVEVEEKKEAEDEKEVKESLKEQEISAPVVEEEPEPIVEEKEEPAPSPVNEENVEPEPAPAVEEEAKTEEPTTVEEVTKEFDELSIDEPSFEEEVMDERPETEPKVEEPIAAAEELTTMPEPPKPAPDLSGIDKIAQTKKFYDTHSREYVDNISSQTASLAPIAHREAFLAHVRSQQQLNNASEESITMLDVGCGYGRDALHFSSLGHCVLAVDYSKGMLTEAKTLAPKVHYLNMDIRTLIQMGALVSKSLDGVWAHASLFHLPKSEVEGVLQGLLDAVKLGGVLYVSLKLGSEEEMGVENGESFDVDERYTAKDKDIIEGDGVCDTRRKLYCYYTMEEVKVLVTSSGWDVMEVGEDDRRNESDYVKHSMMHLFATRRKE